MNTSKENKWRELDAQAETETDMPEAPVEASAQKQSNTDAPEILAETSAQKDHQDKLLLLEKQLTVLKDELVRSHAETQNTQRRMDQEVSKARKFGVDRLLADLIPILESLEHALALPADEHAQLKAMQDGLKMTQDMLLKLLEKNGVVPIAPKPGDPFDPAQHEAMSVQPHKELKSNTIFQILCKGYALHGRVIKAAMVMVVQ